MAILRIFGPNYSKLVVKAATLPMHNIIVELVKEDITLIHAHKVKTNLVY